jgi:hypothetical protein
MFRAVRRSVCHAALVSSVCLVTLGACTKQEHPDGATPPAHSATDSPAPSASFAPASSASGSSATASTTSPNTTSSTQAAAPDSGTLTLFDAGAQDQEIDVPLLDQDGGALPQTEDQPKADSPAFQRRIARLVEAIVKDDAKLARGSFFPVVAYKQVKAVKDPERDWERRLVSAFDRDIHKYHQALGKDASRATLESIEVPEKAVKWMKRGSEGNRLGYFRVLRSRLKLKLPERTRDLEITSMISWRGEWYVVHLNGFD